MGNFHCSKLSDDSDTGPANFISKELKQFIAAGTLAVSSYQPNSHAVDPDSPRTNDIACLNSIESNQSNPARYPAINEETSLVNFSERRNIFLDKSRREFLERNDVKISELVSGQLYHRNRFRELLLGVKAVGKTLLLQTILDYVQYKYPKLLDIYKNFQDCNSKLSTLICRKIRECCNLLRNESENLDSILQLEDADELIDKLEDFLVAKDIYVLLLLDEFQYVYQKPAEIGKPIVLELSLLTGTNKGRIHCIVTGSSSKLRVLAFAKLKDAEDSKYASYDNSIDLNSSKLQPTWILPITKATDFRNMCSIMKSTLSDHELVERYICSGGRPGLAVEPCNINHIPYSLTTKYLLLGDSIEATILRCLFDCMNSYNITYPKQEDDEVVDSLEIMQNELADVPKTVLFLRVQETVATVTSTQFEEALFNLVDAGQLVMTPSYHGIKITVSGIYIYFELKAKQYSKLSWKEAAALKMPQGLFCDLAEDVAMRIIAQKSERLFNLKLECHGKSILNFCDKKDIIRKHNGAGKVFNFPPGGNVDLKDIVNILHKEHYNNKDCCGADGILLSKGTSDNSVHLLRVQLRMGQGTIYPKDIKDIELDMKNRGENIVKIIKTKFAIESYTNYLITTKQPIVAGICIPDESPNKLLAQAPEEKSDVDDEENNKIFTQRGGVDVEELQVEFKVIGPQILDEVWPEEVKSLGKPYGSNKNLH